jgi:hypothetical protein
MVIAKFEKFPEKSPHFKRTIKSLEKLAHKCDELKIKTLVMVVALP